ncbi:muconolactone delta-isomerase domain protein, partial [Bordetella bronchiseptica E014]
MCFSERADKLKADEKALAQQMQRDGKWRHLWRVAG